MKPCKLTLNHADGASATGGGYEFGTLWQEITNGIGHIGNTIVNGLQITERTKQLREYFSLKKKEADNDYYKTIAYGNQSSDLGFYIIVILLFIALGAGLVFAIKKSKQ